MAGYCAIVIGPGPECNPLLSFPDEFFSGPDRCRLTLRVGRAVGRLEESAYAKTVGARAEGRLGESAYADPGRPFPTASLGTAPLGC
jgi:hypothetical protein